MPVKPVNDRYYTLMPNRKLPSSPSKLSTDEIFAKTSDDMIRVFYHTAGKMLDSELYMPCSYCGSTNMEFETFYTCPLVVEVYCHDCKAKYDRQSSEGIKVLTEAESRLARPKLWAEIDKAREDGEMDW